MPIPSDPTPDARNPDSGEVPTACTACSRRTFVTASVLSAVGALLAAACGDGVIGSGGPTGPGGPVDLTLTIADYPELETVGGIATVFDVGVPLAIVRTGSSSYLALSLVCPHQGTTVAVFGNGFRCPNHRASFSPTGTWTGGQRTSNLRSYAVTLDEAAGTLKVTGTSSRPGNDDDDDD